MAVYNSQVTRSNAQALMPEDAAREILGDIAQESVVMSFGRRLPDMARSQRRLPVWSSLPTAYFVSPTDTGLKQTTGVSWSNVYVNAEELAVIVPIPESVLDDADYDIFAEARPGIVSAIGKAFDQAVLYGVNAPATWPVNIEQGCENAGHDVIRGEISSTYIWKDILDEGGVASLVEEDGFMVSGYVASLQMRGRLRGQVDTTGQPIFMQSLQGGGQYVLDNVPIQFPRNGAIDPSRSLLFGGDWSQLVWAVRQDITFKVLTEAVIQDGSGAIVFNLAQQDMVALRVVFRVGWALPNPINLVNSNAATRYPFAVLEPTAPS